MTTANQPRLRVDTTERRRLERVSNELRGPFLARMGLGMTMAEAGAALGWLPAALSRWLSGGNLIAGGEDAVRAFIAAREVAVQR